MIGTVVVYRQLGYLKGRNLGYDKDRLIFVELKGETYRSFPVFKNALLRDPRVVEVSATAQNPTLISSNASGAEWDGKPPDFDPLIGVSVVDYDYPETMGIPVVEGRTLSRQHPSDATQSFLVNEEMARIMGGGSVVGKRLNFGGEGTIVGVLKNFHYAPLQFKIEPQVMGIGPEYLRFAIIRLGPGDLASVLDAVKTVWDHNFPNYPFEYEFFEDAFGRRYQAEERMGAILGAFAGMAILIACLGLFGLASFTAEQRTREIGIRKVLGANVSDVLRLMSFDFAKWVLTANLIAWPAGYYLMDNWLKSFPYKVDLSPWLFLAAGAGSLVVALLTVGSQAIRASLTNPAQAIKYE